MNTNSISLDQYVTENLDQIFYIIKHSNDLFGEDGSNTNHLKRELEQILDETGAN